MFINYTDQGITINPFRKPECLHGDLADLINAAASSNEYVCCNLEGAKDALEDGDYLGRIGADQETVEAIHSAICDYERA